MLDYDDSQRLFERHAFPFGTPSYSPQADIGREIVRKCRGLPLAVRSLGCLLRNEANANEWEKILNSDIWGWFPKEHNILPSLWLSYCYLPPHLKRCFAFCSLFPKGHKFDRHQMALLWMAEGFLPPRKGTRMEDVGEECFDILISRSLFHKQTWNSTTVITMHDLLHDMAAYASQEFCASSDALESVKTRHLSCANESRSATEAFTNFKQVVSLKDNRLRTFIPFRRPMGDTSRNELSLPKSAVKRVRVLSLSCYQITRLNSSIANLELIRYLDLSWNGFEVIPEVICTLHNLETLLLSNCSNLIQLPRQLSRLINLRHLDIRGTSSLKGMPERIRDMKHLQTLTNYVLGDHAEFSGIRELKGLQNLHGELVISGLENSVDDRDVSEAKYLKDKKHLVTLQLTWEAQAENSDQEQGETLLDKLEPNRNLEELFIDGYGGRRFPNWVGGGSCSNMTSLHLVNCTNCSSMPPLGQLFSLKLLEIVGLEKLETIGEEFYGPFASESFRSLEFLYFENMLKWQNWSLVATDGVEVNFPSLFQLVLIDCPSLNDQILPDWLFNLIRRQ